MVKTFGTAGQNTHGMGMSFQESETHLRAQHGPGMIVGRAKPGKRIPKGADKVHTATDLTSDNVDVSVYNANQVRGALLGHKARLRDAETGCAT